MGGLSSREETETTKQQERKENVISDATTKEHKTKLSGVSSDRHSVGHQTTSDQRIVTTSLPPPSPVKPVKTIYWHEPREEAIWNLLRKAKTKEYETEVNGLSSDGRFGGDGCNQWVGGPWTDPVERLPEADENIFAEVQRRKQRPDYQWMLSSRQRLPSYKMREMIVETIENNQIVVITGETGCGKTTQIPQYILDYFIESKNGSLCRIACTQPRRISAISVAERVAHERCVPCGGNSEVGYHIRLENKIPREFGSILYCTTGILLQKLQSVPCLDGFSHIIIDEVHERDLLSDFLLINLKDMLVKRKDLRVILMSATLNADQFSSFFGNCPMFEIPGFTYPVEVFMLEDMIEKTGYRKRQTNRQRGRQQVMPLSPPRSDSSPGEKMRKKLQYFLEIRIKYSWSTVDTLKQWDEDGEMDLDLIVEMLRHIDQKEETFQSYSPYPGEHNTMLLFEQQCLHFLQRCRQSDEMGSVLVFLPGWEEISNLQKKLMNDVLFSSKRFLIIPLHSMLPPNSQKKAFALPPKDIQKIVLATNIAETSITIEDIVYVIDGGRIKLNSLDHKTNIQNLRPEWVSLSNMKQRRGRAGRTRPGKCYHMLTRLKKAELADCQLPEILRSSLEELILKVKLLKLGKALPFLSKAMNPPDKTAVASSLEKLRNLKALTPEEDLTALGFHLARLPMDPRIGKMALLGAIFSCLDPILSIAATLSFKDPFYTPMGEEDSVRRRKEAFALSTKSDHLMFARVMKEWEDEEVDGMGYHFCRENYLSRSTLKMLAKLKGQYAEYLHQIGFVSAGDPKHPDYNLNSENEHILRTVIRAGLYPNVARVTEDGAISNGKYRRWATAIAEDGRKVKIHPKSINALQSDLNGNWVAYHLKMQSKQIFLHDTTLVTPYSLVLFGDEIKGISACGWATISAGERVAFNCRIEKAMLLIKLQKELENLLERKFLNPGTTNWNSDSREAAVLNCMLELLELEKSGIGRMSSMSSFQD